MSRSTTYTNTRYEFAFGVDHAIGTFVQVWDRSLPEDDQDTPAYSYDSRFGPKIQNQETLDDNPQLDQWVSGIDREYKSVYPPKVIVNLGFHHVLKLAKALGFTGREYEEIENEVLKLWD